MLTREAVHLGKGLELSHVVAVDEQLMKAFGVARVCWPIDFQLTENEASAGRWRDVENSQYAAFSQQHLLGTSHLHDRHLLPPAFQRTCTATQGSIPSGYAIRKAQPADPNH